MKIEYTTLSKGYYLHARDVIAAHGKGCYIRFMASFACHTRLT